MNDKALEEPVPGIDISTSPRTTNGISFALHVAGGLCVLITLFLLIESIGWMPNGNLIMALVLGVLTPVMNWVWVAGCFAVMVYGAQKGMPGVAWSPVIFCALWCSISVTQRVYLSIPDRPIPALRSRIASIPDDLSGQTLTLLGSNERCCWYTRALARGQIAAVVTGDPLYLNAREGNFWKATYARGEACRKKGVLLDWEQNKELRALGRSDECIIRNVQRRVPDGLVFRELGSRGEGYTTDVLIRENGRDRTIAAFSTRGNRILSYLPSIGWGQGSGTGIWGFALEGPGQNINLDRGPSVERQLAVALFGDSVFTPIGPTPTTFDPR